MAPSKLDPLAPSEWKVMKVVWEKKACAARDVLEAVQDEQNWTASTVKTLLRRLVEKGYLKTEQIGNSFLYRPTQPALKSLFGVADELLDRAVEGTVAPLLAYLVKKSKLSRDEISELRGLLKEHEASSEEES